MAKVKTDAIKQSILLSRTEKLISNIKISSDDTFISVPTILKQKFFRKPKISSNYHIDRTAIIAS